MNVQVTGRNVDVTPPIVEYAERKLDSLSKHLSDSSRIELELVVEHNPWIGESQVAETTMWTKGPMLRAREGSTDMYAVDRPRRRQARAAGQALPGAPRRGRAQAAAAQGRRPRRGRGGPGRRRGGRAQAEPAADEPQIVKTKRFNMKPMHPEEAALQLELVGHEFFVFLSSETEEVAVIYRRRDGNYGLIEPVHG